MIRPARPEDLQDILSIYAIARTFMAEHGNPTQWGKTYPARELPRQLTIDMGGISFMDSSGIAVLLRAHRQMCRLEGELRVVNVPPQAKRVFQAAGLGRVIRFE